MRDIYDWVWRGGAIILMLDPSAAAPEWLLGAIRATWDQFIQYQSLKEDRGYLIILGFVYSGVCLKPNCQVNRHRLYASLLVLKRQNNTGFLFTMT
jgi:hypothetical protein